MAFKNPFKPDASLKFSQPENQSKGIYDDYPQRKHIDTISANIQTLKIDIDGIHFLNDTPAYFGDTDSFKINYESGAAYITNATGAMHIKSNGGTLNFDVFNGLISFLTNTASSFGMYFKDTTAEALFLTDDTTGNQFVISKSSNAGQDHDHALADDPVLYINSRTPPNTLNTQYMSLYHNISSAHITSGYGDLFLDPAAQSYVISNSRISSAELWAKNGFTGTAQPVDTLTISGGIVIGVTTP